MLELIDTNNFHYQMNINKLIHLLIAMVPSFFEGIKGEGNISVQELETR